MDLWGLVTIVNPTPNHMKIYLQRLVLGGQDCARANFFFRPKSDRKQRYEGISLMGNEKEDYEVHVMFPDNDYPTPPSREGELWVSVNINGRDGVFSVKVTCP